MEDPERQQPRSRNESSQPQPFTFDLSEGSKEERKQILLQGEV